MKPIRIILLAIVIGFSSALVARAGQTLFFSTTFKNQLAKEWKLVGGEWNVRDGSLRQTGSDSADPKKSILVMGNEDDLSTGILITAKLRFDWETRDAMSRVGISVCTDLDGYGLSLVFFSGRLQFLHDQVAWGEGCAFPYESGKWYWMKLYKDEVQMKGKAWRDGEPEPADWMIAWENYDKELTGYPGLNGGSYGGGSVSFAQLIVERIETGQRPSDGKLDPSLVDLQVLPGQPWRLPFGLELAPSVSPTLRAVITFNTRKLPRGDFLLACYRDGKESSRQPLSWPDKKPFVARVSLETPPDEIALMIKPAPEASFEEVKRQTVPGMEAKPATPPWSFESLDRKARIAPMTEILLSGTDWRLGSFPMGRGEAEAAYSPAYDDRQFLTVRVPGEVPLQIGLKGMDLYYQSKELSLINEKEWWYRKTFVPPRELEGKVVRLLFDGVDYFATVWLNGEKLGGSEGCFVPFSSFDVSSKLRFDTENCLVVKVTCPWVPKDRGFLEYMKGEWTMEPGALQFPTQPWVLGPYWDGIPAYGNAVFPMGLFRDVKLVASGTIVISDLFVHTQAIHADGTATLVLSGKALNCSDQETGARLEWKIAPDNFAGDELALPDQSLNIPPGESSFSAQVKVTNPHLWWTWDTGAQDLYRLTASLSSSGGAGKVSRSATFGIRTVERRKDMSYWLNGQRLFLKGGWYPMSDYFLSRTKRADYEKDLELYKAANLNHLVAFTLVENPDFYDLCDRLGILEIFEFPFQQFGPGAVLYRANPRREIFVEESLSQLRQIMVQLRNHPSIIVWTPFAEIGDARRKYGEYAVQIAKLVEEMAPGTIYHPSLCDVGEQHFWMANAGMGTGDTYQAHFNANTGFVSEYGSLAIPAYETFKQMLTPDEMWSSKNTLLPDVLPVPINVPVYAYHTCFEYAGLNSLLHRVHQFVDHRPRSVLEFIDDSQLYQAFIFKYATECYRRKKYNSINGTRIWCYRDLAPRIHWGFVDFYHVPKMGYYYLKTAQARLALSFAYQEALESQPPGKTLKIPVWIINDYRQELPLDVHCEISDLKGQILWSHDFTATVENDGAGKIGDIDRETPVDSGIYVLRGQARERGGLNLEARNSAFIKVVSPAEPNRPGKVAVPEKDMIAGLRVLLIGQKQYSDPIAGWLATQDVNTDVVKEDTIDQLSALRDSEEVRRKYDIVWLACFDSIWKLMDDNSSIGLAQAIKQGVGFIHTGGEGSFHGGAGHGSLIDARPLSEALPVELSDRNDAVYGWFANLKDIQLETSPAKGWADQLKAAGLSGFNEVEVKPGAQLIMTVSGRPLLVAGRYGQGRTVAFTGFTPAQATLPPAYEGLFRRMLLEAGGEKCRSALARLIAQYQPSFESALPLFQNLKDLPETSLQLPEAIELKTAGRRARTTLHLANGANYARLVRMRAEWEHGQADTPFLMFSDNFIDLLPNESRSIALNLLLPDQPARKFEGTLVVEGPNVATRRIPITVP
ncbi:MAG: glutamine amidotransferase [Candidatus Omnitrophica bacterium]|nr:glutamine amidotransferase [Candidatus Omnitrophota bacterium]